MAQTLEQKYKDQKPVGGIHITNVYGIAFFTPLEEDKDCDFVIAYSTLDGYKTFHKHKVSYSPGGRAYVTKGRRKIYLDEVMRL